MQKEQPYDDEGTHAIRLMLITKDQEIADSLIAYSRSREDLEVIHYPGLEVVEQSPTPVGSFEAVVLDLDTSSAEEPVADSLAAIANGAAVVLMGEGKKRSIEGAEVADKSKGITDILRAVTRALAESA